MPIWTRQTQKDATIAHGTFQSLKMPKTLGSPTTIACNASSTFQPLKLTTGLLFSFQTQQIQAGLPSTSAWRPLNNQLKVEPPPPEDTNNGMNNLFEYGCDPYDAEPSGCGMYDGGSFDSLMMCRSCGGREEVPTVFT